MLRTKHRGFVAAGLCTPRQRKFIVYVATSADGFSARKDSSVERLDRPRPGGNYGMGALYRSIDAAVIGRKAYDFALSHGMTNPNPGKKNYILSRTLTKAASAEVMVVKEPIPRPRGAPGRRKRQARMAEGGAESIAAFLDCGQVDEFHSST